MMTAGVLYAQTTDSITQAKLDSIDAQMKILKLKEISISSPKPVYSMTGEVVNYNVENDWTVRDLTAWDAIRNAPTVQVDEEGNFTMRGSEQVEVWLNGRPTGMKGEVLRAFFESMPAEALARIEVIKNPSAKYMVEEGKHILNIVTSTKLRTSELWLIGLSGNREVCSTGSQAMSPYGARRKPRIADDTALVGSAYVPSSRHSSCMALRSTSGTPVEK